MPRNPITAGIALIGVALFAIPARAQDASSWTSGTMTAPQQRGGEAKLLRQQPTAKGLRPSIGPDVAPPRLGTDAQRSDSLSSFRPTGTATPTGSGSLATTIQKRGGGTDPAFDAFLEGRFLTAFELSTKAVEKGEAQAATLLGRLYQEGLGIKQDNVLAAQWYRRASELGDLEGTFAFAVMLAEGDGIQKNRAGAADLFDAAAQRGHPLANYNLALLFLKGDGKPENPHRGYMHMRYAAEHGIAAAQFDLATLHATGTGGVDPSAAVAAYWLEKAAVQGYPDAEVEFATWLFQGRGVPPSQTFGASFFRSAAEKGVAVAQNRLARCYARGAGVQADLLEAAKWHFIARGNGIEDSSLDEAIKALKPPQRAAAQAAAEAWRDAALLR